MNREHYDPQKLAELRKAKMTQTELAEAIGVAEMTVQRAESGNGGVRYEILAKICEELQIDIREVLLPTGEPRKFVAVI
jgi:transcriptional regulator with XRE-family HTH domain